MRSLAALLLTLPLACTRPAAPAPVPPKGDADVDAALRALCGQVAPGGRVEQVSENVFVARGYDLANVALIRTPAGNVIVDSGLSPATAATMKAALLAASPGPIKALILTHTHLDHVGGASVFAEHGTEIWATQAFTEHFLKQYSSYQPIEQLRGMRQYGMRVPREVLPCTSLGPLPDIAAAARTGARLPTRTFKGSARLVLGGTEIRLEEAHGETHDQLFVWLPSDKTLISGDNIYRAFPNIYTIRGTTARPVDDWIDSLDRMRRLAALHVVPMHTAPIQGAAEVQEALTAYRDAIQYVRDETVRGANAGRTADQLAATIKLPEPLARHPFLQEVYGRVDWSVRGIYEAQLGWFGGEAYRLHALPEDETARRELALMGGADKVAAAASEALTAGDTRWALHLFGKLREAGTATADGVPVSEGFARALDAAATATLNTNARGYLAEAAIETRSGPAKMSAPEPDEGLVKMIPLQVFLSRLALKLSPERSRDVHEALRFDFTDTGETFTLTARRGIAELAQGTPLPGTPPPVAVLKTDSMTWKRVALKQKSAAAAVTEGKLAVEGSWIAFLGFMHRFELE